MNVHSLLEVLANRGATVTARGEVLTVTPRSVLDDALRVNIRALKHELLALLSLPPTPSDSDAPQVKPQVLEGLSTWGGREVLRPDLYASLGLAAFDEDPPEPCPHPRLVWVRDLGCWLDGDVVVSTVATAQRRNLYYAACRVQRMLEAGALCVGYALPPPHLVHDLAVAMVQAAQDERAWRAAGASRCFADEFNAGAAFDESSDESSAGSHSHQRGETR